MKIASYQFDARLGAPEHNLRRIRDILNGLREETPDVILFPEMCDTGYAMDVIAEKAVTWDGDHLHDIRTVAAELGSTIIIGLSERVGTDIYNTAAVIGPGGTVDFTYRKTHLVSIEPIGEHRFITPGDRLGLFELGGVTCGLMTCYELRFPEVARSLTLSGAKVLFVPAAWPAVRRDHLLTLLRARAIENQVFVVASCRVGTDAGTEFSGHSLIIDPDGNILERGSEVAEDLLRADIDLAAIDRCRERIGALEERRPELYG